MYGELTSVSSASCGLAPVPLVTERDVPLKFLVAELPEVGQDVLGMRVVWALNQRSRR